MSSSASFKKAGAWLNPLSFSSLGLQMDDNTVRVAIGLCLSTSFCRAYRCAHWEAEVDKSCYTWSQLLVE